MEAKLYLIISLIALCFLCQITLVKIVIKAYRNLLKGQAKKKASKCPYKIEKEDI